MSAKKEFGKRLKFLRRQRNLSQAQLAEMIGVENQAVSKIENGNHFVKSETLDQIKEALEVSYADLFTFDDKSELPDKRFKSIIFQLKSMSDDELAYILSAIKAYKRAHKQKNK